MILKTQFLKIHVTETINKKNSNGNNMDKDKINHCTNMIKAKQQLNINAHSNRERKYRNLKNDYTSLYHGYNILM